VLTLGDIRSMAAEMLDAEASWLPQFAGKSVRPVPMISIPAGTVRQAVPTDPALAIAARFGKLADA
jgi:alpha-galactosidase